MIKIITILLYSLLILPKVRVTMSIQNTHPCYDVNSKHTPVTLPYVLGKAMPNAPTWSAAPTYTYATDVQIITSVSFK
jgi:hypothetical protein